jgi:hypothetical protein
MFRFTLFARIRNKSCILSEGNTTLRRKDMAQGHMLQYSGNKTHKRGVTRMLLVLFNGYELHTSHQGRFHLLSFPRKEADMYVQFSLSDM